MAPLDSPTSGAAAAPARGLHRPTRAPGRFESVRAIAAAAVGIGIVIAWEVAGPRLPAPFELGVSSRAPGVPAWALRLPMAAAALGALCAFYTFVRRSADRSSGGYAVAVLATIPAWFVHGRTMTGAMVPMACSAVVLAGLGIAVLDDRATPRARRLALGVAALAVLASVLASRWGAPARGLAAVAAVPAIAVGAAGMLWTNRRGARAVLAAGLLVGGAAVTMAALGREGWWTDTLLRIASGRRGEGHVRGARRRARLRPRALDAARTVRARTASEERRAPRDDDRRGARDRRARGARAAYGGDDTRGGGGDRRRGGDDAPLSRGHGATGGSARHHDARDRMARRSRREARAGAHLPRVRHLGRRAPRRTRRGLLARDPIVDLALHGALERRARRAAHVASCRTRARDRRGRRVCRARSSCPRLSGAAGAALARRRVRRLGEEPPVRRAARARRCRRALRGVRARHGGRPAPRCPGRGPLARVSDARRGRRAAQIPRARSRRAASSQRGVSRRTRSQCPSPRG